MHLASRMGVGGGVRQGQGDKTASSTRFLAANKITYKKWINIELSSKCSWDHVKIEMEKKK